MRRSIIAMLVVAGCGSIDLGVDDTVDNRVPIPAPDPAYLDIISPEAVVQPGEEAMYCLHVENDQGEVAIDNMVGLYATGGHHIALYTTTDPKPPGTFENCTSPEANAPLQWYVITSALGPGQAISMPSGFRYVLQFHYINSTDHPMRVRDVARIHRVDPAQVKLWVGSVVAQDFALEIPPGDHTLTWDCVLPTDRDLVFMFGHMHEWGTHYKIEIGPSPDALSTVWDMDWKPAWRDGAPGLNYQNNPRRLPAGTIIRSTCTHRNTTNAPLTFPVEMCMTFSYMGGSKQTMQCLPQR